MSPGQLLGQSLNALFVQVTKVTTPNNANANKSPHISQNVMVETLTLCGMLAFRISSCIKAVPDLYVFIFTLPAYLITFSYPIYK